MPLINCKIEDTVGKITFTNNPKRNIMTKEFCFEIINALKTCQDANVRALILACEKDAPIWSAGHDISEFQSGQDPLAYDSPMEQMMRDIEKFPAIVIGQITGSAYGGGCLLASLCDLNVGVKDIFFRLTPLKIGLPFNSAGITTIFSKCGIALTKEMFFTAAPISAEKAYIHGLLNFVSPSFEEAQATAIETAKNVSELAPLAVKALKEQIRLLTKSTNISSDNLERIEVLRRSAYCSNDFEEGRKAFFEKRKPTFTGS